MLYLRSRFPAWIILSFCILGGLFAVCGQTGVNVRIMAANLNGNSQTLEPFATRIFQGLDPDIVAIQEFNYGNNTTQELRAYVDQAFGPAFVYYRESNASYDIPNGIISRYPIIAAGSWDDVEAPNRGYAWARIDLPGTNDLYVVSVHFLTDNATRRATEANQLKSLIQANFPTGAWIVVAGDFNTDNRTEQAVTTFNTFLSDRPIPVDQQGDSDTNNGRDKPYDYVLASLSMTNRMTNTVFASGASFSNGLVFDSREYAPLSDVSPVLAADSGLGQHMAVVKDFHVPVSVPDTGAPAIVAQPQSLTNGVGATATFQVSATGNAPLTYIWSFNGSVVSAGTSSAYSIQNVQPVHAGSYRVVVTNTVGAATSAVATLTVTAPLPQIVVQPQSQVAPPGSSVVFYVTAEGGQPLSYQWRSNTVNIAGATLTNYVIQNVQASAQADYTVVVTNTYGSVTSAIATLTVGVPEVETLLAGWDVNLLTGFGPSPMAPTTNHSLVNVTGLTRGSGVLTTQSAAQNAWGGHGFDSTSASAAVASGKFVLWAITAPQGYTISFSSIRPFGYRRSSTGPPNGLLEYMVGTGLAKTIGTLAFTNTSSSGELLPLINLSGIGDLQGVAPGEKVTFRLAPYGGQEGGTWYIYNKIAAGPDMAVVGSLAPVFAPPADPPVISDVAGMDGGFTFLVTGTAGSNYVVEASTNLAGWMAVKTNRAPFSFTNSAAGGVPKKFFRARVAP